MSRPSWPAVALFLVAVIGIVLLARMTSPPEPDPHVELERQQDSARVAQAQAEVARVEAQARAWQDSAQAHRAEAASYKASADQKAARIAYLLAHPKVIAPSVTPGYHGPPLPVTVDSSATCEERYELRTGEAADLRRALEECGRAGAVLELRGDTLATANGRLARALAQSDSARRAEIVRKRPCRRDWVVAHPSCGTADVVTFIGGFMLGVAATR